MGSPRGKSSEPEAAPAFDGAPFDKDGFCIKHGSVQLASPTINGRKIVYDELRRSCPKCVSAKNKSKKGTSISGGKTKRTGHMHGFQRRDSNASSKKSDKPRKVYDSPFDDKGRCHYHKSVQMAALKRKGGWTILHKACPKCMEENFTDDRSLASEKSGRSKKSEKSRKSDKSGKSKKSGSTQHAGGKYDKNGCCVLHTHVQVAKKKFFGGFKVLRACPICEGYDIGADDFSVASAKSSKSNKSVKSIASTSKPGQAQNSGRYGQLPFDGDGYCCQHPSIRIAKKKVKGGWKIIHDVCPECAADMAAATGGKKMKRRNSESSRKSGGLRRRNSEPQRRKSGSGH